MNIEIMYRYHCDVSLIMMHLQISLFSPSHQSNAKMMAWRGELPLPMQVLVWMENLEEGVVLGVWIRGQGQTLLESLHSVRLSEANRWDLRDSNEHRECIGQSNEVGHLSQES